MRDKICEYDIKNVSLSQVPMQNVFNRLLITMAIEAPVSVDYSLVMRITRFLAAVWMKKC